MLCNQLWIDRNQGLDLVLIKAIDNVGEYGGIVNGRTGKIPRDAIAAYGKRIEVLDDAQKSEAPKVVEEEKKRGRPRR